MRLERELKNLNQKRIIAAKRRPYSTQNVDAFKTARDQTSNGQAQALWTFFVGMVLALVALYQIKSSSERWILGAVQPKQIESSQSTTPDAGPAQPYQDHAKTLTP